MHPVPDAVYLRSYGGGVRLCSVGVLSQLHSIPLEENPSIQQWEPDRQRGSICRAASNQIPTLSTKHSGNPNLIHRLGLPFFGTMIVDVEHISEEHQIPRNTIADRVRHVVQSAFNGQRIVIFSGGAKKGDEQAVLDEIRQIRDGGGFGSIIGRNVFQRERKDALRLLDRIITIYREKAS
jgi:hypothetical protein